MKWPFSRNTVHVARTEPQRLECTSLGIDLISQEVSGQRVNILDLGPAFGSNVEFYNEFSSKINIEDLYQALTTNSDPTGMSLITPEFLADTLPQQGKVLFDLVMVWDLFNYLTHGEIKLLMDHLSSMSAPGAYMFTLISTQKEISDKPMQYRIVNSQRVEYLQTTGLMRVCPRHNQYDLKRLMPEWERVRSFALRNGMHEMIFRKRGGDEALRLRAEEI